MTMESQGRDFVMPFGKYQGQTLEEIYIEDKGYIEWLVDNMENDRIRESAEQCLEEMKMVTII